MAYLIIISKMGTFAFHSSLPMRLAGLGAALTSIPSLPLINSLTQSYMRVIG
jgi:hypothetical protein